MYRNQKDTHDANNTIIRGCAMKILGKAVAALGLPRVLVAALSVIVGGDACVAIRPESDAMRTCGEAVQPALRRSCGPIALQKIFRHYGIRATLAEITASVPLTRRGTSLGALKEAAEARGMKAEGWRICFEDLQHVRLPAIVYVNGNHFLVVDSIAGDDAVFVSDARGAWVMTRGEFLQGWHGETLILEQ